MSTPQRHGGVESTDASARKRVCKACDRCRMKKSKCDGMSPCSRCQADNTICVFGERKKTHDKKYPNGYTEMIEQQHDQLIACVREMYRLLQNGESWPGEALQSQQDGHPLTHHILERLNLLEIMGDRVSTPRRFEEDLSVLERRALLSDNQMSKRSRRHESYSSDSDQERQSSNSSNASPALRSVNFIRPLAHGSAPATPPSTAPHLQTEMNAPFKVETHNPFLAPDFTPSFYSDPFAMGNTPSFVSGFEPYTTAAPPFQLDELSVNPAMVMTPWSEYSNVEMIDMVAPN